MVEELNNKDIDKTLDDNKIENERETTVKKSSKHKKKESTSKSEQKTPKNRAKSKKILEEPEEITPLLSESLRKEHYVEYDEFEFSLREINSQGQEILIGPKRLTRFEKARITGARSLQISFGAPLMVQGNVNARSSISLAIEELEKKALPISIRRTLPNGIYQDIPIEWLKT
ncbi:MAG TPA: DNA-directed RNA polymerase subunit K [Nitrososphaeraceae archaeon]|nr:DNA-directed RNA polymerase subunit K [Nitrososphaeraceae archaeon]